MTSPYLGFSQDQWAQVTENLIAAHPLSKQDLVKAVLQAWEDIFESSMGGGKLRIGDNFFPKPQVMGDYLHELIPEEIAEEFPGEWRGDQAAHEKDLVCIQDDRFSVEIKTSSSKKKIFGNRSYAQKGSAKKKSKSGYYLAVNFEKFADGKGRTPEIRLIRFGWLDAEDWQGQKAATGQQASLAPAVEAAKLLKLYPA